MGMDCERLSRSASPHVPPPHSAPSSLAIRLSLFPSRSVSLSPFLPLSFSPSSSLSPSLPPRLSRALSIYDPAAPIPPKRIPAPLRFTSSEMASPHASPPPPPPPPAEAESLDEQQHFASILRAFDHYEAWGLAKVERMEADYRALSRAAQEVTRVAAKLDGMRMAISQNACVLDQLLEPHRRTVAGLPDDWRTRVALPQPDGSTRFVPAAHAAYVPESDMEKVQSTIKQMVREWGEEGEVEREAAHAPVLEALCRLLPEPEGRRVLLPGAGLGRLVWDVARLGYTAQGNEFSYFMLLAANFVLNELCRPDDAVVIHPWALQTCNNATTADQLRAARVPHVPPNSLPPSAHMSMCAGDFLEV